VTNAHAGESPIFAIKPTARGDISLAVAATSKDAIVWSTVRGGSYSSTPVVYGDYIYFGDENGVVRCFQVKRVERSTRSGSARTLRSTRRW
jgi:hypothetical protein